MVIAAKHILSKTTFTIQDMCLFLSATNVAKSGFDLELVKLSHERKDAQLGKDNFREMTLS